MTRRVFHFAFIVAAAVAPLSAGLFSDSEPKASKGTSGERASYIEGTQKGIAPHTAGTLSMQDNKVMAFQYGKGSLSIPYANITNTEIGPGRGKDAGPAYKVWNVHKRFADKTRYLTIHYTENGLKNKLVFEVADRAATLTVSQIEIAQGKRVGSVAAASTNEELWWGDKYWKTSRNNEKWNRSAEASKATAPDQE